MNSLEKAAQHLPKRQGHFETIFSRLPTREQKQRPQKNSAEVVATSGELSLKTQLAAGDATCGGAAIRLHGSCPISLQHQCASEAEKRAICEYRREVGPGAGVVYDIFKNC